MRAHGAFFCWAQPNKVTVLLFSESIYNISVVPNSLTTMIWKNRWVLFVGYEQTGYYCLFFSLLKSSRYYDRGEGQPPKPRETCVRMVHSSAGPWENGVKRCTFVVHVLHVK
jgi:hypothetical protein